MNRNDRAVTAFAMLGHASFHAVELAIPLFVAVWLDVFAVSPAVLGVVVGLSYAVVGLGALPTGILADRMSARTLVVACLAGMGGALLLVAIAPSLPVLAVALVAWGVAGSIYHPAGLTLLSRATRERGRAFALHGVAGNVGIATGPLLAAVLLGLLDWRLVTAILVIPIALALLAALRLEFDETAGAREREGAPTADGGTDIASVRDFLGKSRLLFTGAFLVVFVVGILYGLYYRGATTFLPEILAALPLFEPIPAFGTTIEPSRYVYAGLLLVGGLGQYTGGRLVDAVSTPRVLVGGYVALAGIGVAFVPLAGAGLVPLLAGSAVLGFFVFMIAPINQEAISAYTAADVRGLSFGYSYAAIFGVGAMGSVIAGVILTRTDAGVLFLVLAGLAAVAAGIASLLLRE